MEMCYDGALVMPSSYAVMNEEEMSYVEGGFSVSKSVFSYIVNAAVMAGCVALGGGISVAGLRTVLGSMSMKKTLISVLVKAIGKLGISAGNALANKFVAGLAGCICKDFAGAIFDKFIDGKDGKMDGKIKIR